MRWTRAAGAARRALATLGLLASRPRRDSSSGPVASLERDLASLGDRGPRARAMLAALAWARGPGLPPGDLWPAMARALAEDDGHDLADLTATDLAWARAAQRYLTRDGTLFRLRDQSVAAYLRGEPGDGTGAALESRRRRMERAITGALLGSVPRAAGGEPDWAAAHPYTRLYLCQHAAAGGATSLLRLLETPGFLLVADPASLAPLLDVTDPVLRKTARMYHRAAPMLGADPSVNAAALLETVATLGGTTPADLAGAIRPTCRPRLISVMPDESLLTLTGHAGWVQHVAVAEREDRRLLIAAACEDGRVWRWDPHTAAPLGEPLTGPDGWLSAVAMATAPDGTMLLAAGGQDRLIWRWDARTGQPFGKPLAGHTDAVLDMDLTIWDGRLMLASASRDGTARLWDPLAGTPLGGPLPSHEGWVNDVRFSPAAAGSPLVVSAGHDRAVRLWDTLTRAPAGEPMTFPAAVHSMRFGLAPDGRLLLALLFNRPMEQRPQVWDVHTRTPAGPPLDGHTERVTEACFTAAPDGRLLLATGSRDRTIRLWDPLTSGAIGEPLTGHTATINAAEFTPPRPGGPLLVTGGDDRTVRLWDVLTPSPPRRAPEVGRWVDAVAFGTTPDARTLVAAAGSGGTWVWDVETGETLGGPLTGLTGAVRALAFGNAADEQPLIAAAGDGQEVRVWNPLTGATVSEARHSGTGRVAALAFGLDGDGQPLLISGGEDAVIRLWHPITGAPLGDLTGNDGFVSAVAAAVMEDGRAMVASASGDTTVRVWDTGARQPAGTPLTGHTSAVRAVALARAGGGHGPLLVSAGEDGTIRRWDPMAGAPLAEPLAGHESWITAIAVTSVAGQRLLISGGGDATVRIWDPGTGSCQAVLRRRCPVRSMATMGPLLAIGDDDGFRVLELT